MRLLADLTARMTELILVTGANGYIASRLIPRLLDEGYRVRALARDPARLQGRTWLPRVEVSAGDTTDPASLARALEGVHSAYYLVHSMASGPGYDRIEREAAGRFAGAAEEAGVEHIIYLGGLADPDATNLAPHLRSRMETGEILRRGRVPVTEFRAGVIVGAGSISFEMIRFLTECFPLMPGPNWLRNNVQPIAAGNVIDYLVAALDGEQARGGIYEMGGPDLMRYADAMLRYAESRRLRRWLITFPGIPISVMARVVDWLSPVPYSIATPLVGGLQSDSVVLDDSARRMFPRIRLTAYEQSVQDALSDLTPSRLERVWEGLPGDAIRIKHEGFFIDSRRLVIGTGAANVYGVVAAMGGPHGWPYADWMWRARGWIDRAISPRAAGWRQQLQDPGGEAPLAQRADDPRRVGSQVDYYRVEAVEPGRLLRLHSELRAPGEGWMEWRVESLGPNRCTLTQTAFFAPRGLPGFLYWVVLGPLHRLVFRGLIRAIRTQSEGR